MDGMRRGTTQRGTRVVLPTMLVLLCSAALLVGLYVTGDRGGTVVLGQGAATAQASGPPPVDREVVDELAKVGTDVTIVETSDSPAEAVDVAARAFGQTAGRRPGQVSLAKVTVRDYTEVPDDPKADPAEGRRVIDDRLVWLVVFDDVKNFVFGPAPRSDEPAPTPTYDLARLVVMVDAGTTTFLRAETVASATKR